MSELEWCREHAPEALRDFSDEELIKIMHSSYVKFIGDDQFVEKSVIDLCAGFDLSDKQQRLDCMVVVASNILHNRMALKGGYLLSHILGDVGRTTKDVDFDVPNAKTYEEFKGTLREIGELFINRGLADDYTIDVEVNGEICGGFAVKKDNATVLKCDIGWRDLGFGTKIENLNVGPVNTYTVERILSDKIVAILGTRRYRRTKDLYDIFCLSNTFSFDARLINVYIKRDQQNPSQLWDDFEFNDEILSKLQRGYNKLRVINLKGVELSLPLFENVINRFNAIANKVKEPGFPYIWDSRAAIFNKGE